MGWLSNIGLGFLDAGVGTVGKAIGSRQKRSEDMNFQREMQANQQQYGTSERLGSQEYGTSERIASQKYQTQMSNTAHQREIEDLKAAGLNPILSVSGGQGATTPSSHGASSSGASSGMGANAGAHVSDTDMEKVISSAFESKRLDIDKKVADQKIAESKTSSQLNKAIEKLKKVETKHTDYSAKTSQLNNQLLEHGLPLSKRRIDLDQSTAMLDKGLNIGKQIVSILTPILGYSFAGKVASMFTNAASSTAGVKGLQSFTSRLNKFQ